MRGPYVWESSFLIAANKQIMAERARLASPEATASEAQRRLLLRNRDVPASCICKWSFQPARDRWVLMKQHRKGRAECPWHSRAAVRGGVRSAERRAG